MSAAQHTTPTLVPLEPSSCTVGGDGVGARVSSVRVWWHVVAHPPDQGAPEHPKPPISTHPHFYTPFFLSDITSTSRTSTSQLSRIARERTASAVLTAAALFRISQSKQSVTALLLEHFRKRIQTLTSCLHVDYSSTLNFHHCSCSINYWCSSTTMGDLLIVTSTSHGGLIAWRVCILTVPVKLYNTA